MTEQNNRKVMYDCRYFLGDRPCVWHKQKGDVCVCERYIPLKKSLLIIKLDAMGDVLRTTSLLPVISKAWFDTRITWITKPESVPLLENNSYITDVLPYGSEAFVHLLSRKFDRVVNLDASKISAGMTSMANGKEKIGYILRENGYVMGTNAAAEEWLRMGIFDDLKRSNKRSYQEIMCSILGLPVDGLRYVLELTTIEKEIGIKHFKQLGLDLNKSIVGIHTGGGGRWLLKQWKEEKFIDLITELKHEFGNDIQIVLFGGPLEREINQRIITSVNSTIFDAGCENHIRHFSALINCCSIVLSGDSLAMHVAIALGRRVVVLFGPTSSAEIDLFNLGEKVVPKLDCLVCYKKTCNYTPNCMESISVDMVKGAVVRQLKLIKKITNPGKESSEDFIATKEQASLTALKKGKTDGG